LQHEEAVKIILGKPAVTRRVFDGLLPELRGRAFVATGIESAQVLRRLRELVAELPRGGTWDEQRDRLIEEMEPYLGEGAGARATLLLRTHGFQAFNASEWRLAQEDADTTHLQYLATEDERVRATHLALNGLVLPKGDPFWEDHYPPWEWNCRCRVRAMNPDMVAEARGEDAGRNPEDRMVLEGAALEKLRQGQLVRGTRAWDVSAPAGAGAYRFNPNDLTLTLGELEAIYRETPEVWAAFEEIARGAEAAPGLSLWDWLKRQ
jgi:SPP1 gp7 family putative phage head morphogenesis protein